MCPSNHEARTASEVGATATEYLFLLVLIAIVLLAGVQTYGQALQDRYDGAVADVIDAGS